MLNQYQSHNFQKIKELYQLDKVEKFLDFRIPQNKTDQMIYHIQNSDQDDVTIYEELLEMMDEPIERGEIGNFAKVMKDFKLKDPKNILDVGSGDGLRLESIVDEFPDLERVVGVDIYPPETLSDKYEFILVEEGKNLPFDDETFDLVIASQSLHHIKNVDKMLREIHRVLKPEGKFFIREHDAHKNAIPFIEVVHGLYDIVLFQTLTVDEFLDIHRARYFTKNQWKTKIERAGFTWLSERKRKRNNDMEMYYALFEKSDKKVKDYKRTNRQKRNNHRQRRNNYRKIKD